MHKLVPYLTLMVSVFGGAGCYTDGGDSRSGAEVHLLVDSLTVARGKWEQLAAPMTWWIDPHGPDTLYQVEVKRFKKEQVISYAAYIYLEEVVKEGHYAYFMRTSTSAIKDVEAGLETLGLVQERQILAQALKKFKEAGKEGPDLSEEDSRAIQLREEQPYTSIFRAFVQTNSRVFFYNEWVKRPE